MLAAANSPANTFVFWRPEMPALIRRSNGIYYQVTYYHWPYLAFHQPARRADAESALLPGLAG